MAGDSFFVHLTTTLTAITAPLAGALTFYARYRRSSERDRRAREEAARIASEKAASDARKDEQGMRERLLSEKDARIKELSDNLSEERAENKQLHRVIEEMQRKPAEKEGS